MVKSQGHRFKPAETPPGAQIRAFGMGIFCLPHKCPRCPPLRPCCKAGCQAGRWAAWGGSIPPQEGDARDCPGLPRIRAGMESEKGFGRPLAEVLGSGCPGPSSGLFLLRSIPPRVPPSPPTPEAAGGGVRSLAWPLVPLPCWLHPIPSLFLPWLWDSNKLRSPPSMVGCLLFLKVF